MPYKILLLVFSFFVCTIGIAGFQNPNQQVRVIAEQLRCPVCRGIPIAESPSELAQDMVQVIRQKLAEGKTEAEILDYFEDRYGEWILLKPKPQGLNLIVWLLPILFLAGGGLFLAFKIRRWSHKT